MISIIIPNWNGQEKLKKNLPDVLKVKGVDEIIVSDDSSTDQSVKLLQTEFPQVTTLVRERNGGFAVNVNYAVKQAKGEFVFLLNSDAAPEKDCVIKAINHFKDPEVFSVSFNTGGNWSWARFENGFFWHFMKKTNGSPPQTHQTLWGSGGSMIFRKKIWDDLGGFDELYSPFYEEDVDLGYRATKRGFINIWEKEAKVEHYKQTGVIAENFSQSTINKTAQRNQLIFIWKNIIDPPLIRMHIFSLIKMLLIHPKYWLVFIAALLKINKILKKREIEKKQAKFRDKEILGKFS